MQEPFGLAQREMGEESQGQGGRSRWRDPSSAAARLASRSGGVSRQRSLPRTTTPSHRRVERGPDCRPASSQRGTSSDTWDEPSTASLQCGSCGDEKGGPNRPTRRSSCNNAAWFHLYGRDMTKTGRNRTVETVRTVMQLVTVGRTRWLLHDLNRRYRGIFNETV